MDHCYSQPACQKPIIAEEINEDFEQGMAQALQGVLQDDDLPPEERARAEMGWEAGCASGH